MTTLEQIVIDTGGDPSHHGEIWVPSSSVEHVCGMCFKRVSTHGNPYFYYCTADEYHATKARLQNRPSFKDHPDAVCFVQNESGIWVKNTKTKNVRPVSGGIWESLGGCGGWVHLERGEVIGNWRDTLEVRPEQEEKTMKAVGDAVRAFDGKWPETDIINGYLESFLSKSVWSICALKTPAGEYICRQDDFEAEARRLGYRGKEWGGPEDGLPPVGTVCKGHVQDSSGTWRWLEVEILKHNDITHGECAVHVTKHGILRWCDQFRPLQSERDKWIDAAERAMESKSPELGRYQLGLIYDANLGRLPE